MTKGVSVRVSETEVRTAHSLESPDLVGVVVGAMVVWGGLDNHKDSNETTKTHSDMQCMKKNHLYIGVSPSLSLAFTLMVRLPRT